MSLSSNDVDVVSSMVVDVLDEPPMVVEVLDPTDVEVEPDASDVEVDAPSSDVVVLSTAVLLVEPSAVVDDESPAIEVATTDDEVEDVAASLDAHATPTTTRPAATAVTIPSIFLSISGTSFGTSPLSEIPAQARFSTPSTFHQGRCTPACVEVGPCTRRQTGGGRRERSRGLGTRAARAFTRRRR
ncbi:MAG: hypothetical protein WEA57_00910 [Acidimicrobiia bacterium]